MGEGAFTATFKLPCRVGYNQYIAKISALDETK
jgi:hypothetical protein